MAIEQQGRYINNNKPKIGREEKADAQREGLLQVPYANYIYRSETELADTTHDRGAL